MTEETSFMDRYVVAVKTFLEAGPMLRQPTPPAVSAHGTDDASTRGHVLAGAMRDRSDTVVEGCAPAAAVRKRPEPPEAPEDASAPKKRPRSSSMSADEDSTSRKKRLLTLVAGMTAAHASTTDAAASPSMASLAGFWLTVAQREEDARAATPARVIGDYPSTARSCVQLPQGSRRRCINVIYAMAAAMNLEVGTPGLGVLLFDRYMSARRAPVSPINLLAVAMLCLVVAGKIADVDRGFCGSKGIVSVVRSAAGCLGETRAAFSRRFCALESEFMHTMGERLWMSPPTALQCVSEFTNWNNTDGRLWMRALFHIDVFLSDTASTQFRQWEIARAAVSISRHQRSDGDTATTDPAEAAMRRACRSFANTEFVGDVRSDMYIGVRARHVDNPGICELYAEYKER